MRGELALYEGDMETARVLIGEALTIAEETGNRQAREHALTYLTELDILEGCAKDAVARLEAEPLLRSDDVDLLLLGSYARALLASGDVIHAEQVVELAVTRAREGETLTLAEVLLVQAAVRQGTGRADDAYPLLTEALALAHSMQDPYFEARVRFALGTEPGSAVSPSEAFSYLKQALGTFRRLGASLDVERTERALEHFRRSVDVLRGADLAHHPFELEHHHGAGNRR
jgi:tetratricopeptide (TPR) repeat protein